MAHRIQRISALIRNTIGEILLTKISDPRLDPAAVSITRVVITPDLLTARVYVSVTGSSADQRKALRALSGASGYFQELLGRRIRLRNTPKLEFYDDDEFHQAQESWNLLREVAAEPPVPTTEPPPD